MLRENKVFFPTQKALLTALIIIGWAGSVFLIILLKNRFFAVTLLFYLIKIGFALSALTSLCCPAAKSSFVFLILAFPYIAIPVYLCFRRTRLSKNEKKLIEECRSRKPKTECFEKKMLLKCNENFTFLREIASYSTANIYTNTAAKYFSESDEMLISLMGDIKCAKRFVFLEFYTVCSGEVFGNICELLCEKAREGLEIKILYDELGSLFKIPEDFPKIIKKSGIEARCGSPLFAAFPSGINNRNHRKIAIIDGEVAYTGGINLADEYVYSKKKLGKWKDFGIRIEGEAVCELTHTFLSDFVFSGGECEDFAKYYKYKKIKSKGFSLVFEDGPYPLYEEKISERLIASLIDASEKSFTMTSPYLIFDSRIYSAVCGAVKRGVRVKIIIPSTPDKILTSILTRRYAYKLSEIGAEIYLYLPGFLHSKIYCSDKKLLMCGTVNLDYRSLRHNFENGILFSDHPVIDDAVRDLDEILSVSIPLQAKKTNPIMRFIGTLLEVFAPLF